MGQILTKLSTAGNFKSFGQFAWIIGLVTLRITTDRAHIYERMFIMDVFDVGDWSFTGRVQYFVRL